MFRRRSLVRARAAFPLASVRAATPATIVPPPAATMATPLVRGGETMMAMPSSFHQRRWCTTAKSNEEEAAAPIAEKTSEEEAAATNDKVTDADVAEATVTSTDDPQTAQLTEELDDAAHEAATTTEGNGGEEGEGEGGAKKKDALDGAMDDDFMKDDMLGMDDDMMGGGMGGMGGDNPLETQRAMKHLMRDFGEVTERAKVPLQKFEMAVLKAVAADDEDAEGAVTLYELNQKKLDAYLEPYGFTGKEAAAICDLYAEFGHSRGASFENPDKLHGEKQVVAFVVHEMKKSDGPQVPEEQVEKIVALAVKWHKESEPEYKPPGYGDEPAAPPSSDAAEEEASGEAAPAAEGSDDAPAAADGGEEDGAASAEETAQTQEEGAAGEASSEGLPSEGTDAAETEPKSGEQKQ